MQLDKQNWSLGQPLVGDASGFGSVFVVSDEAGNEAVAKLVPKDPGARRELLMGDSIGAAGFKNVVPVLDQGSYENQWVIVMPRAEMSLAQYLRHHEGSQLPISDVLRILTDIATALAEIGQEIVHRDLKPANVLLLNNVWSLADFGIARYAEATTGADTRKFSLTRPYAAPEQWQFIRATAATDVYAFGVMAYELTAGRLPFEGPDYRQQHLLETPPELTMGTTRLRTLIEECLYKAPEARPMPAALKARLQAIAAEPTNARFAKLAQANQKQVARRAVEQAEDNARRTAAERREQLNLTATQAFETISRSLLDAILDNAPAADVEMNRGRWEMIFVAQLGVAKLGVSEVKEAPPWDGPFEVISTSTVAVNAYESGRGQGWQGRAHSLWFCDPHQSGQFAWHELAFMDSPFSQRFSAIDPYPLDPGAASVAFMQIIGSQQLAWPVEQVDRGNPQEFLERWIGWFADAATGDLSRPLTMPERPVGTWRTRD